MSKLPATEIVDLVKAIGATISVAGQVLADGKVDLRDLAKATDLFSALRKFTDVDYIQLMPEAKDLDAAELAQIAKAFKDAFDLPQDNIEILVEQGLSILVTVASLVYEFYEVLKPAQEPVAA